MWPQARRGATSAVAGSVVSVAFTTVLLGRSLGSGVLLYRDFVTVPDPVLSSRTWGWDGSAPRSVPLDAVTSLLAPVISPGWQQQAMLVAALLLAGIGVAVLVRHHGWVASCVAAALATWSPYAAERLLLGQPPTLLAWSALPWLVLAVQAHTSGRRRLVAVTVAAAPAALTPYGGLQAALVVAGLLLVRRRDGAPGAALTRVDVAIPLIAVAWCLPWVVPALAGHADAGQSSGAAAFRVDGVGVGGVLDVLGGGGVWSVAATLGSRAQPVPLAASVLVLVLALAGVRAVRHRWLAVGALLGPPVAVLLLATGPGIAATAWAQHLPGVALARDTHRLLGLSAFATAVLAGIGAAAVAGALREGRWRARAMPVAVGVALVGVAAAPLTAPDAAGRLSAAYGPVAFPSGLRCVVSAVGERTALVLPWQPLRRTDWARGQVFLDPLPLALAGRVVSAHDLTVERDGVSVTVGDSDPSEAAQWRSGRLDVATLRRLGIERVVEWRGTPGVLPTRHDGLDLLVDAAGFTVWAVPGTRGARPGAVATCTGAFGRYDTQQ